MRRADDAAMVIGEMEDINCITCFECLTSSYRPSRRKTHQTALLRMKITLMHLAVIFCDDALRGKSRPVGMGMCVSNEGDDSGSGTLESCP